MRNICIQNGGRKIGGFNFIGYCDNAPTAIAAYRALYNTEGEIFYDDARTIRTDEIPDINLLVDGFPCQPFSAAGRKLSFDDERGDLFFELTRILEAKRPEFFVFENVPPIRTIQQENVFISILSEISRLVVTTFSVAKRVNGSVLTARLFFPKAESEFSLSDILIRDVLKKYYLSGEKAERLCPGSTEQCHRDTECTM